MSARLPPNVSFVLQAMESMEHLNVNHVQYLLLAARSVLQHQSVHYATRPTIINYQAQLVFVLQAIRLTALVDSVNLVEIS